VLSTQCLPVLGKRAKGGITTILLASATYPTASDILGRFLRFRPHELFSLDRMFPTDHSKVKARPYCQTPEICPTENFRSGSMSILMREWTFSWGGADTMPFGVLKKNAMKIWGLYCRF
tara:strand:+ start:14475 stop:14831 length:357 start_codon:yes stop_codon:yes gene_type:complete